MAATSYYYGKVEEVLRSNLSKSEKIARLAEMMKSAEQAGEARGLAGGS
jgi:hypothetical protein